MVKKINLICPIIEKECMMNNCAWWSNKDENCAVRIIAKLPIMGEDPLEALLGGGNKGKK